MLYKNHKTLIIGRKSNLSSLLERQIGNTTLLSANKIVQDLDSLQIDSYESINLIFNNFQTAARLNQLDNPFEYIERSIQVTAIVLTFMMRYTSKINKIIYTSSSSVYGDNIFCSEQDMVKPLNLHASLKVSNEKLIEKFSKEHHIDYTIARVFNMYGGDDNFSIVSKMIRTARDNKELTIVNNGNGIRDFIHIDDVVIIYKKLLQCSDVSLVNVGTGEGVSIKNILDYLKNHDVNLGFKTIERQELKISTANNKYLLSLLGDYTFKKVEQYILDEVVK